MFTGIIEAQGVIRKVTTDGANRTFRLHAPWGASLTVGQSVSHNGVCLTVEAVDDGGDYEVTAIAETLARTNLNEWRAGDLVNLERAMPANGRYEGHIVQGHVDATAVVRSVTEENGSWRVWFDLPQDGLPLLVTKGSIAVDGVSLTAAGLDGAGFAVAIIPHTFANTRFGRYLPGSLVNIEYDVLGKYVSRLLEARGVLRS